jgi:hypothetical protein
VCRPQTRWRDRGCSSDDAIRAEQEASSLSDWDAVYESYKRFHACDDGSIAEGYSESVSTILGNKWSTIDRLKQIMSRDKSFEAFVLAHLDESVPRDRLRVIDANARNQCPDNLSRFCRLLIGKLERVYVGGLPGQVKPFLQK